MSFKGTLRSIAAAQKRSERESIRKQRELERRRIQLEKMQEVERVAYVVETFENYIDTITSIQKDCADEWDWEKLKFSKPPVKPSRSSKYESLAQSDLDTYEPKFMDKILSRTETKRAELEEKIEEGRIRDTTEYNEALEKYKQEYANWELIVSLAERILDGDEEAYSEAIRQADPFSEISQLGSAISFNINGKKLIESSLKVHSDKVIPREVKTQLKSGKLSTKDMPRTRFYGLYQDYVCGAVLRIARELFALLPIDIVIVTEIGQLLNTKTGHMDEEPVLSVIIPRDTQKKLNFEMLNPSNAMDNFIHNMRFLKTKGFRPVQKLLPSDIEKI